MKRDFLSSTFSTTGEQLGLNTMSENVAQTSADSESVAVLPWVPLTTSAVSLRLFEFDESIVYVLHEKPEPSEEKEDRQYIVSLSYFFYFFFAKTFNFVGITMKCLQ